MYDLIIIGGGPAGLTAGLYCARARVNVLMLEKLAPGGQVMNTDWVENYPGFPDGISGFELVDPWVSTRISNRTMISSRHVKRCEYRMEKAVQ